MDSIGLIRPLTTEEVIPDERRDIDDPLGPEVEDAEQSPEAQKQAAQEAKREEQKQKLLSAVSAGKPKTIEEKVAWVLNVDPNPLLRSGFPSHTIDCVTNTFTPCRHQ